MVNTELILFNFLFRTYLILTFKTGTCTKPDILARLDENKRLESLEFKSYPQCCGCLSRIRIFTIPDPGSGSWFFTHPGSRGQKGTGSRIRIRNTDNPVNKFFYWRGTRKASVQAEVSAGERGRVRVRGDAGRTRCLRWRGEQQEWRQARRRRARLSGKTGR